MAKTHAARFAELEATLASLVDVNTALTKRVIALEEESQNIEKLFDLFSTFLEPGTPVGEMISECLTNPDDADEIIREAFSDLLDVVGAQIKQNISAMAEGHGINPTPKPTLYAEIMKGFHISTKDSAHG